jgi:hypothetical protein
MLSCGDTFLTGDGSEDLHLWIIITPPTEGEVVTVCMVTAHKKSERLVVLNVGDHPFIKHESIIAYRWSRIRAVDEIETAFLTKAAKQREPMSESLLKKMQNGLLDSEFTPNGVLHYYKSVIGS